MAMPLALRRWLDTRLYLLRGPQPGPFVLAHRRVYILPTAHGYVFFLVLLLMLAGSVNYSLSLGFVLTFLLAGLGVNGILYAFRNLANLRIVALRPRAIFAGETAEFPLRIENPTDVARVNIAAALRSVPPRRAARRAAKRAGTSEAAAPSFDVAARGEASVLLVLPSERRGKLGLGRVTLYTRYPLGLFRAWSYLEPDVECIVYPRPEPPGVPLPIPTGESGEGAASMLGTEDFSGLRSYHAGDSPRRIAWKADAREQGLLTKVFSGRAETHLWLDWATLPAHMGTEERLARLTRWVLEADAVDCAFGLRLPGTSIPPASGAEHRTRCLEALAFHRDDFHQDGSIKDDQPA